MSVAISASNNASSPMTRNREKRGGGIEKIRCLAANRFTRRLSLETASTTRILNSAPETAIPG